MIAKEAVLFLVLVCVASLCRGAEVGDNSRGVYQSYPTYSSYPSSSNPYEYDIKIDSSPFPGGYGPQIDTKTLNSEFPGADGSKDVDSWYNEKVSPAFIPERPVIVPDSKLNNLDERVKNCGKRKLEFNALLTNAQETKPGDWPWHAAIYRTRSVTAADQNFICGGTLISKRIVITAGHCVVENGIKVIPERIFVILGKYNIVGSDVASQEKEVFEIILREAFSVRTLKNDIAILKLASEVGFGDYVQPICTWDKSKTDKNLIVGKHGTVVGWGLTENGVLSTKLGRVVMPVASDYDCLRSYPAFYERFLNTKTYCAGFRNGTGVCNGDSGGGMYFPENTPDGDTVWTLRGLVSVSVSRRNTKLCDANNYAVFTDITKHLEWIGENQ